MEENEKPFDMEIALFWAEHIENPCTVNVNGEELNIRDYYLRESRKVIPRLGNPLARRYLEMKIKKYDSSILL